MRFKLGVVAAAAAAALSILSVATLTAPAQAAGGPAVCAATGTVHASPGLNLTSRASTASFSGTATCVGGTSGPIFGSGVISGTCATSKASFTVGGALKGHVSVTTLGGVVVLTGTLNGSPAAAVGLFVPTTGNCATTPVTAATFVLAGALA